MGSAAVNPNAIGSMVPPFGLRAAVAPSEIQSLNVRTPANGGNDDVGTGSTAAPFATPAHALAALGGGAGVIHMGSGTYVRPLLADFAGPVVFVGDGGGDPLDDGLTEVIAPQAAGVGTAAGLVVGAGFALGNEGDSIEFLTGPAAGQRRTIVAVEGGNTQLVPARNFIPAPVAGNSFRVVRPAVIWNGFTAFETWLQRVGAPTWMFNLATPGVGLPTVGIVQACYLVNLTLDAVAATTLRANGSVLCCYGVELSTNFFDTRFSGTLWTMGSDNLSGQAQQIAALLGLATADVYAGYTVSRRATNTFLNSFFGGGVFGYVQGRTAGLFVSSGAVMRLQGGECGPLSVSALANTVRLSAPRMRVTATGATSAVSVSLGGSVDLSTNTSVVADAGDALRCQQGGFARVSSATGSSVTGNGVNASQGGQVYLSVNPVGQWTGGSADFRVSATEVATNAAFGAVDNTLVAAVGNGSLVTRTS